MKRRALISLLPLAAIFIACGEDEDVGHSGPLDAAPEIIDALPPQVDSAPPPLRFDAGPRRDATLEPDAALDAAPDAEPDAAPAPDAAPRPANWVEVTLTPRQTLYAPGDEIQATAVVYGFDGAPFADQAVRWAVEPEGLAAVDAEGLITVQAEGQGRVHACASEAICGSAAFFVDSAPPVLMITQPARGAILGADGATTIPVRGTAVDEGGAVWVWINGEPVDVDADGVFSLDLPARFGVNLIEVIADDGVRRDPVVDLREVLWAPRYEPVDPDQARVRGALVMRMDQALLDTDTPIDLSGGAGEYVLEEFAQLITALIALIDPSPLLEGIPLGGEGLNLSVEGLDLGTPLVDLAWIAGGMEIFLHFPHIRIQTSGALSLEGASIDLTGAVEANTAAFVHMSLVLDGAGVLAAVEEVGINVESITGDYADPSARALIETLDGQLSQIIVGMTEGLISQMLADQLPTLFNAVLGQLFGPEGILSDINLDLSGQIEGLAPINLSLSFEPQALDIRPHETMAFTLDAAVRHPAPVTAPHEDPGVPAINGDPLINAPGEGFGVAARLALINALLHEVWRAGLLQMNLPLSGLSGVLDARLPPVLAPTPPGAPFLMEIQLGDLRLRMQAGEAPPDDYTVSLRVGVDVSLEGGAFELVVADEPEFEVQLLSQGSARPLISPEGLAGLLKALIWPKVEQALAGGMRFELPATALPVDALQAFAPEITALSFSPIFDAAPYLSQGRVHLEGGVTLILGVTPAE